MLALYLDADPRDCSCQRKSHQNRPSTLSKSVETCLNPFKFDVKRLLKIQRVQKERKHMSNSVGQKTSPYIVMQLSFHRRFSKPFFFRSDRWTRTGAHLPQSRQTLDVRAGLTHFLPAERAGSRNKVPTVSPFSCLIS